MPREKSIRKLNFKPSVKSFIPESLEHNGTSSLLHEEIEAIYLMDILGLYQEEAAKSMEVSRPTFTRILKGARQKVANALVGGFKIEIEDTKENTIIAFCSNNKETFENIDPLQQYILIYNINGKNIDILKTMENPIFIEKLKPAIILPKVLLDNKVNIFISSKIGEGLINSLISKGIKPIIKSNIDENSLVDLINNI